MASMSMLAPGPIASTVLDGFCSSSSSTTAVGKPASPQLFLRVYWHAVYGLSLLWTCCAVYKFRHSIMGSMRLQICAKCLLAEA